MAGKKRSEVWNHFIELNSSRAQCEHCESIISITGGSTGNLIRHMRMKHKTAIPPCKKSRQQQQVIEVLGENVEIVNDTGQSMVLFNACEVQPDGLDVAEYSSYNITTRKGGAKPRQIAAREKPKRLSNFNNTNVKKATIIRDIKENKYFSDNRSKQYDKQLVKMITKEFYPLGMVESVEFKNFIKMISPTYSLPCKQILSSHLIPQIYQTTVEKVKQKLSEAEAVCLSTDGWTSVNGDIHVALTAHFVTREVKSCSVSIGCVKIEETETVGNLASVLARAVDEWDLTNKIIAVVTDNSSNIQAAVRMCGWKNIECFASTINYIAQSCLGCLQSIIDKVKVIVQLFKQNPQALCKLQAVREEIGLEDTKLKRAITGQWNSTYDMIVRLIKLKEAIITTLIVVCKDVEPITPEEWVLLEKLTEILKIFNEVTVEISSDAYIAISKVMILLKAMINHINKFNANETLFEELHPMMNTLSEQVNRYFAAVTGNDLVMQATFLDPRFKKHGFTDDSKFKATYASLRTVLSTVQVAKEPKSEEAANSSFLWDDFDIEIGNESSSQDSLAVVMNEMDKFLQEPMFSRREDPLAWWKSRQLLYPRLYDAVKKRLCIVANSVPCDKLFSKEGYALMERRTKLMTSKFSQLVFLNANLE